ncbi:transposase [Accumulibacter sp.]
MSTPVLQGRIFPGRLGARSLRFALHGISSLLSEPNPFGRRGGTPVFARAVPEFAPQHGVHGGNRGRQPLSVTASYVERVRVGSVRAEAAQAFRSKGEIALDMVRRLRREGLHFSIIAFDGGYGHLPWLLGELDREGETFFAEVHSDQAIYLQDPAPAVPARRSSKGRSPRRRRRRRCR